MRSTRSRRWIRAPRPAVYRALLDADAVARWRVPLGMTAVVHAFEPVQHGHFRVSLIYDVRDGTGTPTGKSDTHTDTYHGHFAELIPDRQVVEIVEFETADPALRGEMTITTVLCDRADGTDMIVVHERIPPGVPLADNELGTAQALDRLAALLEGGG